MFATVSADNMWKACRLSLLLFVFHCCCSAVTAADDACSFVDTRAGRLRGKMITIVGKPPVCQYLGIPFAQPPLGDLRYREPRPFPPWQGTRNATEFGNSCAQVNQNLNVKVSEDCLFLNIWTPVGANLTSGSSLAVFFWIHGGGFVVGTSAKGDFNGAYMAASENIIVASTNYRLGTFGFLYLGDVEVPGNMGLLDQHFALRWAYNNIDAFGGNRDKITLVGESAGAASVNYQLLAQQSWPFINAAIIQSGAAIATWAFHAPDDARRRSAEFAEAAGCSGPVSKVVTCLRNQNTSYLLQVQRQIVGSDDSRPLLPTIDANWFIADHPQTLTAQGNVKRCPLLLGSNSDEFTLFIAGAYLNKLFTSIEQKPLISEQQFLDSMQSQIPTMSSTQRDQMQKVYYQIVAGSSGGNKSTPDPVWIDRLDEATSDFFFVCPMNNLADSRVALKSPAFLYHFDHRSSQNPFPAWMGVMHTFELAYVFGVPLQGLLNFTQEERSLSQKMVTAWSSFVKTGYPKVQDVEWPEYNLMDRAYVHLVTGQFDIRKKRRFEGCQFWNSTGLLITNGVLTEPSTTRVTSNGSGIVTGWLLSLSVFIRCSALW